MHDATHQNKIVRHDSLLDHLLRCPWVEGITLVRESRGVVSLVCKSRRQGFDDQRLIYLTFSREAFSAQYGTNCG
jgi:hypothetical protein